MIRETIYDEIHDAQRHFRTLLDGMARPGKIDRFTPLALTPPKSLGRAAAYVGFALLNADVAFHADLLGEAAVAYLRANTRAVPAAGPADADFLFLDGGDQRSIPLVAGARVGLPAYPETGASVVVQVRRLGKSSGSGRLRLDLSGPGIESRETVFIDGLAVELLDVIGERNREFPLGIDTILVGDDETLLCLPRTTRVVRAVA